VVRAEAYRLARILHFAGRCRWRVPYILKTRTASRTPHKRSQRHVLPRSDLPPWVCSLELEVLALLT
jgi:hypothetical protein